MPTRRDLIKLALLAPWLSACGGGSHGSEQPIKTNVNPDDWPVDTPANQGIAASAMQSLLDEGDRYPFLYSVLAVRNGQLIGERYYNGAQSSDLRSVASVTKTVSSLLVGQALADGKIASTSDTLAKLLPKELVKTPNAYAAGITLQQLLDMTGGQVWDEQVRQLDATNSPDMTAFALALPGDGAVQGANWRYSTAASHLLSPILRNAYGIDELAIATKNLFDPMGIKDSAWSRDATGMIHGSFGLQLRTRDLMKLAWMSLQGGQWQGRTVVPAPWIAESMKPVVRNLFDEGAMKKVGYHNLWWSSTMAGLEVHSMQGHGGQFAILVPQLNLTIATAAELNLSMDTAGLHAVLITDMVGRFLESARS